MDWFIVTIFAIVVSVLCVFGYIGYVENNHAQECSDMHGLYLSRDHACIKADAVLKQQVGEAIPGSPAFALRGLYKLATEYFIDGKPATPDEYIAWQRGIIEALTSAKIPDPKYYGTQDEDGYRHEAKCAYVDGWNECRASILAKDASPSRECGERQRYSKEWCMKMAALEPEDGPPPAGINALAASAPTRQDCPHGVDDGACKRCYGEATMLSDEQARTIECADSWLRMRGLQTYTDLRDTLFAVLRAIGYTEEFAEVHPDLKVSEGVKLFLAASAPTRQDCPHGVDDGACNGE